ncbi:protein kinase [Blastopirellula sp. J2-11]|uniref:WD40 domain-containing protein n=1 Tax=Blastopirellula sp. J2-11 TaxID=2943192 RepID=UPI0021CAA95F|nr:protein kinase [Blastopirellula sp. J2-11]UUO08611.1 protein kinase [Blastopirellula sp. J2-11]
MPASDSQQLDFVQQIFDQVIDLQGNERQQRLDELCRNDSALRQTITELLAAEDVSEHLFDSSIFSRSKPTSISEIEIAGYKLLEEISCGGQGVVYRALQLGTRREVAIKFLLPRESWDISAARLRFQREVDIVCSLNHPGIVPVFDSGVADGRHYYVMDYVRGQHLDRHVQTEKLTVPEILGLMARVCETVGHAHQRGVIHRDLKPGNILVDETGRPRILDFGLSRVTNVGPVADSSARLSLAGQLLGTLGYMGPEHICGQPEEVDIRSDVFALGVILYELLAEELPFDLSGTFVENLTTIKNCVARPLKRRGRSINREVETITLKALSSEKSRRYQNGSAMATDIQRYLDGKAIEARRDSTIYVLQKTLQMHWPASLTALAVLLCLVCGLLIYRTQNERLLRLQEANEQYLYDVEMELAGLAGMGPGGTRQIEKIRSEWSDSEKSPDRRRWEWYYLNSDEIESLQVRSGHRKQVWALAVQSGGERLASGGMDGVIRLWSIGDDGRLADLSTQFEHPGGVTTLQFHPQGNLLASAGKNNAVQIFDLEANRIVSRLDHPQVVTGLAWSPDGRRLVTVCEDGVARLWRLGTATESVTLVNMDRPLKDVQWCGDGRRVAVASSDGLVEIWDVNEQRREVRIQAHVATLVSVNWNPDGTLVATTSDDATTRIWNAESGDLFAVLADHSLGVTDAVWSGDGKRLATCSRDATICVYRLEKKRLLLETILRGHTDEVLSLEWGGDGKRLFSAGWDQSIRTWNLDAREERSWSQMLDESILIIRWDHSGKRFLTIGEYSTLLLWTLDQPDHPLPVLHNLSQVNGACWSPDNQLVAICGIRDGRGAVEIRNLSDAELVAEFRTAEQEVIDIAWRPTGGQIAACGPHGMIKVWSTDTWRQTYQNASSPDGPEIRMVDWNSAGTRLATAGPYGFEVRNAGSFDVLWQKSLDAGLAINGLKFSPDGNCLATVRSDAEGTLWDSESGERLTNLIGHGLLIYNICWHPDSTRLATSSRDGSVRIWNANTGREVHRFLIKPVGRARGLDWSPDGYRLAISNSVSHYGVLRIFDAESGYRQQD